MKINRLEIENVKRVHAVRLEPNENGLTVIGGRNGQGKTSVLDAIAWALGGESYRPSNPARKGSVIPPRLKVELSNGIIVERKGKNSALTVTDPKGDKAGQRLLDSFIEKLALDLPKFMQASNKEKANTLLQIIGVEDELNAMRNKEQQLYNRRYEIGRIADQKAKFAKEMKYFPEAPKEPVSAGELIQKQQDILARNGENARKRQRKEQYNRELAEAQIAYDAALKRLREAEENAVIARKDALDLQDESTEELERNIRDIEEINRKVRANLDKDKAEQDAAEYKNQYDELTIQIEDLRDSIMKLLNNADLPLPGLSVNDQGELTYKGFCWDDMSSSEQLKVATAIIRKLNPECGFVLIDKLEQMDTQTMKEFGDWLEQEGLQAICTRVSTGDECQIIIEDGMVAQQGTKTKTTAKPWKEGSF